MTSVLDVEVSCFAAYNKPDNPRPVNLLTWLTSLKHRAQVDDIRAMSNKTERDALKATLPAITPSGLFTRREDAALIPGTHSRLICLDIDPKHNGNIRNYGELKQLISQCVNVAYCGYSVSATGVFVLVYIAYPDQHEAQFRALQQIFKKRFRIKVDDTPAVSQLRGYSYDPNGFFRHDARPFTGIYTPPPPTPRKPVRSQFKGENNQTLVTRIMRFAQNAPDGQRHTMLLKAATVAGGYIAAGKMDEQTAVYALETVASEWPNFTKSQKTIRDGIRYGLEKPIVTDRSIPNATPGSHLNNVTRSDKVESIVDRVTTVSNTDETTSPPPPIIRTHKPQNFFEWQCEHPAFSQLGLNSLTNQPKP